MPWSSITYSSMENAGHGFLWTPPLECDLDHWVPAGWLRALAEDVPSLAAHSALGIHPGEQKPPPHRQIVAFPFREDQPTLFLLEFASPGTSAEFGWDKPFQEHPPPGVCPTLVPCLTLCNFAPCRFQGSGIFQWHLWLPVPHLPIHGGPAGAAPGGGLTGLAGDDGSRGEGRTALPGPGFHGRGSHRMAPKSNGTVSPCFTSTSLILNVD